MQTQEWMNRPGARALGLAAAGASVLVAVLAFLRGDVPVELTMLALGASAYALGTLLGTGRGWLLWAGTVVLVTVLGWLLIHPAVGILGALVGVAASVLARRVLRRRKRAARYLSKLAAVLAKETRDDRDPGEVLTPLASWWRRADYARRGAALGLPVRWNVPSHIPMDDTIRIVFASVISDVCKVRVTIKAGREHIDATPAPPAEKAADDPDAEAVARMNEAIRPAMGAELSVKRTDRDQDGELVAITLTWPASYTSKALSPAIRNRVGTALSGVVGGAWQSTGWSTEDRTVIYRRMADLPTRIPHPGRSASDRADQVPFATLRDGGTAYMNLGSETPHCLIVGATSQGKSSLLRALLVGMPEGARATLVDPKRISMQGMDQLAVVASIATRPDTMARAIADFEREMDRRYEALESGAIRPRDLTPLVLVIDEGKMLFKKLDIWWAREEKARVKEELAERDRMKQKLIKEQHQIDGETDIDKLPKLPIPQGTRHPAIDQLSNLVMGGRQAKCFLILCSQRPDADWLGGTDTRDQFSTVVALGNLGVVGSRMAFGTPAAASGLSSDNGRAWIGMGTGVKTPHQAQVWWVPEVDEEASGEDLAILERLGLSVPSSAPQLTAEPTAPQSVPQLPAASGAPQSAPDALPGPAPVPQAYITPSDTREPDSAPAAPQQTSVPAAYLTADVLTSPTTPSPNADHDHAPATSQVREEVAGDVPQAVEADLPDLGADHDDDEAEDTPAPDLETVDALDIEEGDVLWADLGKGELEPVSVVSVEVNAHSPELLEIGYTGDDGDGLLSVNDDDPVQREPR